MDARTDTSNRRQGRRWRFASAVLDEQSWTLTVNGRTVPIETKPLELLHELVTRAGETVSKEDLLVAVWPHVSVVEASLATAVLKVRRALAEDGDSVIQTVPRIGYKLAAPVTLELTELPQAAPLRELPTMAAAEGLPPHRRAVRRPWYWGGMLAGVALAMGLLGFAAQALRHSTTAGSSPAVSQLEAQHALRELDLQKIRHLLSLGWDPNKPFDNQGTAALHFVVEICEWNPGHDRQKLMLAVRMLLDANARVAVRNVWGDTPYSIARAKRFCGTEHPVSHLLHVVCFEGLDVPRDKCQADYAGAAANRRKP